MGTGQDSGRVKVALVAGATGLTGGQLVTTLLDDPRYSVVKAITRKPLARVHPKLENPVIDFDRLGTYSDELKADDIFCCLGTTMKSAGSKEAFERVDYHYPVVLAERGKALGASQFLLISALGASKKSAFFYNRVKGKVEEAISGMGYPAVHIMRPALLVGPREEHRQSEAAAKWFFRTFGFLVPAKYKAIASIKVARAMVHFANSGLTGIHIHESAGLQKF
ncbi:MAG TPA: oxidoreductase [Cyclobacteriaceae bacterium]